MPYNTRIKEYGNGTLQLTFYGNCIWLKDDHRSGPNFIDLMNESDYVSFNNNSDPELIEEEIDSIGFTNSDFDFDDIPSNNSAELSPKKNNDFSLYVSMNRSKRMIYDYGRCNVWEWFFTLTFERNDDFDAMDYSICSKKISQWFNNIRKRFCSCIKYLAVPEQHESGAWHFHVLVSNCDEIAKEFTPGRNNQMYRKNKKGELVFNKKGEPVQNKYFGDVLRTSYPDGDIIYNIGRYRFGFSTATKINDTRKAVSYICKYITKDLSVKTFGKRRYLSSNNLELPKKTFAIIPPDQLEMYLHRIEYVFGQKLSISHVKKIHVNVPSYQNYITVFEFEPVEEL